MTRPCQIEPRDLARTSQGVLVSLATYNEAGNLKPLVESIRQFAPECSILVIDDNSPDGTGKIADELAETLPAVHVIHRAGKLGLGTAMLEAIHYAVQNNYEYLLNLDADFSHPPRFIPALIAGMSDHDVMIGSRYVPGGGVEGGFNLKRKFMSSGINWLARTTLGLEEQRQQRLLPLLPREQTGCRLTSEMFDREAIRSRKRSSTGASELAAGSVKRRSCSRTGERAAPRSTPERR